MRAILLVLCIAASSFGQAVRYARDYYQQLYDAGGFFDQVHTSGGSAISLKMQSHVCFSDEPKDTSFFVFSTFAYDPTYAKSWADFTGGTADEQTRSAAWASLQTFQDQAPYVSWMSDLSVFPAADVQKFFNKPGGGRILWLTRYSKGVKTVSEVEYHWWSEKQIWEALMESADPKAYTQKTVWNYLSIEPKTMRWAQWQSVYVQVGEGATAAKSDKTFDLGAGTCEAIKDRSKKE